MKSPVEKYYHEYKSIYIDCGEILKSYAKPGLKFLDAGCGAGNPLVIDCLNSGMTIIGVDNDAEALKRNTTYHKTYLSDVENLPFQDSSFDIVGSFYLMEHLKNPIKVLKEFSRTLKMNGYLIMMLPNLNNPVMLGSRLTPFGLHKLLHRFFSGVKRPYKTYFRCNTTHSLDKSLLKLGFERKKLVRRGSSFLFSKIRPLLCLWIVADKMTNMRYMNFLKADICVVYQKIQ